MTTLEAVNIILAGIGQPAVTALDTNGTSDAGEAENFLNAENLNVQQERSWWFAGERWIELELPDTRLTVTGTSGTFTFGETVTQATSGATGTFKYEITISGTKYVYLVAVSGTFDNSHAITGGTSAATRNVSALSTPTEARHAVDPDWSQIRGDRGESRPLSARGDSGSMFLYDGTLGDSTFDFDDNVTIRYVGPLLFTELPRPAANFVARSAAVKYQCHKFNSQKCDAYLSREKDEAWQRMLRENNRNRRRSMVNTVESEQMRGVRRPEQWEIA